MKPKVFISRRLPEEIMREMEQHFLVKCNPDDRNLNYEELKEGAKDCDVIVTLLANRIDREFLLQNSTLKGVCNYAVGYNNIDVAAASELGILVCNTPGVLTQTTADLAWSLLMSAARRIAEGDRYARAGKFNGWAPLLLQGQDIYGKTLGIIGAGRIGEAVAQRSSGFAMKVVYYDNGYNDMMEKELGAKKVGLNELLKESDFISLHVPYNESTHHLIGEEELALMKNTCVLINTARGRVVEEKALITALKNNKIAAAGLDVFYSEPDIPKAMCDLENIVIVPHIGSATKETRIKMAQLVLDCAIACVSGKLPPSIVNPEVISKK